MRVPGSILPRDHVADGPPRLALAHIPFFVAVFLALLHLRFSSINFTLDDAATLAAACFIVLGRRPFCFLPPGLSAATYVFLLFALLSTFRAPQPVESVTQILQFAFTFFVQLPVILTLAQSRLVLHASLGLLLAARLVDATDALLSGRVTGSHRALSRYDDSANQLAYPTAYLLPFLLYGLLQILRRTRSRPIQAATILGAIPALYLMLWVLAASGSRSAALATVVGTVAFLTLRRGFEASGKAVLRLVLVVAFVCSAGYSLDRWGYFPSTLSQRVELTLRDSQTLTQDRIALAKAGWQAFLDSPFLGVGLDNFRYVTQRYGLLALATDPHNMWIDLLAKVGLFGTAALFSVVAGWFLILVRAKRGTVDSSHRELLSAFLASMTAIMTIHMFVPLMLQRQYWLVYGLGLAWAFQTTASQPAPSPVGFARTQAERYAH